ncbi:CoA-binding protein [Cryptosporangium minutisporangium]|uniref:CoA-binding protein n=1 Tax=Cryptosporangium minutisporangium TaxID=113569 RepID=A0ABP6SV02_9ACTN
MSTATKHSDPDSIRRLLAAKTWAFVGLTDTPYRTVYQMAAFLQRNGVRIVPVNPRAESVLGEQGYTDLEGIPFAVDVVGIYRRSEFVAPHVDEAIRISADGVWMPLDVVDEDAAARALDAGLTVVMDHCPKIEWPAYGRR